MKRTILFIVFVSLVQLVPGQTDNTAAAIDWVNKNNIPINYVQAGNGFADMEPLNNLIGDARIVAMGECTHGSSEIFSMKHRMLEFLVKEKGFTIFAIEANMPEAYALNEYIINGKGDPKKLLIGMYFWTWNTQEVLDMIEWMKTYNETAANKIMFTGFDMQDPRVAIKNIRAYLQINKPELVPVVDDYDNLYKEGAAKKDFWKHKQKGLVELAADISSGITAIADSKEKRWIIQNVKVLEQYGGLHNQKNYRDECMAANAKWILDENPGAKMMIWAHNEHIRKLKNKFGVIRMGNLLNDWYKSQYISIAFATEEGTYTAVKREKGLDSANVLVPSVKGSCEYIFKKVAAPNFIIDLRKGNKEDAGTSWLFETTLLRDIGAIANDEYQFIDVKPLGDYDMLLFLKKTSSSKCFSINHKKE